MRERIPGSFRKLVERKKNTFVANGELSSFLVNALFFQRLRKNQFNGSLYLFKVVSEINLRYRVDGKILLKANNKYFY